MGLLRGREFEMKDLYSFDADDGRPRQGLRRRCIDAYMRIFERCGVPVIAVHADSGAIGGKESQ